MKLGELRKLVRIAPDMQTAQTQQRLQEYIRELGLDLNMLYQELEMTSRFVDTHRDTSFPGSPLQLHSHTFFELLYCCNDCGAEYLVGAERYRLQRGDIIFIPPGVSHRPLLPETMSAPYTRYILWLSPEFMERYAMLYPYPFSEKQSYVGMLRTAGTKWERLGEQFRIGIQEAEQQKDGWEAAVIGNTMMLLTQIKRATDDRSAKAMKAEKPELLDQLTAYIEQHFSRSISLEDLAAHFYISASTISHLFKQKMGVSFYRYVTQRRLIAAKTLIGQGLLLDDVSSRTGFADYSSFYRAFRQEFGISPRQYRKIAEAAEQPLP